MDESDTVVMHLVIGPDEHGVVRDGIAVARACGHRLVRAQRPGDVDVSDLSAAAVLHVPYTDRLFAVTCEESAIAFRSLVKPLVKHGVSLSVTLHDLPAGRSPLDDRRRTSYRSVVADARGIVVHSQAELAALEQFDDRARSVALIPLPVQPVPTSEIRDATAGSATVIAEVAILGFIFPDRGYEQVIDELPPGVDLVALGRPSEGHHDLPERLIAQARAAGHHLDITGFVPDDELAAALRSVLVPVAPNRRVAASGSIATWLAHGRRPLVPATPYTRELDAGWPGTVVLYDPDTRGALRKAIEEALADPETTWLASGINPGYDLDAIGSAHQRHFDNCRPDLPLKLPGGRFVVPGNRWDLLHDVTPRVAPAVSVIVPYFEAQPDLDLVLTALAMQRYPGSRLQVVVADDGSATAPNLSAAGDLDTRSVQQPDAGFRAAAARNLGAAAADGEVLLFLDGDTIPEPDYIARMVRLPAVLPDAMVVGRRRHADLAGWTPDCLQDWLSGISGGPPVLEEPTWLLDGYRISRDLLQSDDRSYRYLISAVLGIHRDLFAEIGGFSTDFVGYGGEDWELAHRAWVAGAVFAHVRGAVAWHNGPEWAARPGVSTTAKNRETLVLSRLLPDPIARGGGQWIPYPAMVVELPDCGPAGVLATARWAFDAGLDCGIYVSGDNAAATVSALSDPRIRTGPPARDVLDRAVTRVYLDGPVRLPGTTAIAATAQTTLLAPTARVVPARAQRRSARWALRLDLDPEVLQRRLFGERAWSGPEPIDPVDLAHELSRVAPSVRRS